MRTEQDRNALLESVSRSFFLTIRALPKALRHPVRTAYLLARASDTIADTTDIPLQERKKHLQRLRDIILDAEPPERSVEMGAAAGSLQSHAGERILLTHLPEVLADYAALEPADHTDVRWVLEQITEGQLGDLDRPRLKDAAELERYTWLVAGCVGEFWTRIGVRKLRNYARLPDAEMIQLGADFGKGLQLVNILRDLPEDAAQGRCYLPDENDFARWKDRANLLLENGWRYVLALNGWRLRLACALPVLIGLRTLALLGTVAPRNRIKVPRGEVRSILFQTALRAWSRTALANYRRRSLPKG